MSATPIVAVLADVATRWRLTARRLNSEDASAARALSMAAEEVERALAVAPRAKATPAALPAGVAPLLTVAQAAAYLGLSERYVEGRGDLPRLDVAAPGATRPCWRYRLQDLERFAEGRIILPYTPTRAA